jgi:hypothetical protein
MGGWASSLAWVFAIPICLSTASCLLPSAIGLAFFAVFPRPRLTQRWRWALVLAPLMLFGLPIVASAAAMIYAPSALAKTLAARAFRPRCVLYKILRASPPCCFSMRSRCIRVGTIEALERHATACSVARSDILRLQGMQAGISR